MPEILKYHTNPKDLIAAIARPEVAEQLGLAREDFRALYPMVVACLVVGELRKQEMPIAIVEAEGYPTFEQRVRGEFRDSHLADYEVHEAYGIVCQYARDPNKGLHFKFETPQQMQLLTAVKKDMGIH
jgi:hypothetical protein